MTTRPGQSTYAGCPMPSDTSITVADRLRYAMAKDGSDRLRDKCSELRARGGR